MTDQYSGASHTDPQSTQIRNKVKAQKFSTSGDKKSNKEEKTDRTLLYEEGVKLLEKAGLVIELVEGGDHINHRILKSVPPVEIEGIDYPPNFRPYQDISTIADFRRVERVFDQAPNEVRDFWMPLYRPKSGENDFQAFTDRLLAMNKIKAQQNLHQYRNYHHSFDPDGSMCGYEPSLTPKIWVPAKSWFDPIFHNVTLDDVFTIFPKAEIEILTLLLGRIGVGRSNHLPPGFPQPIDHTARMAGVIVGKDAGLGKSTLFNGLTAALSRCGFNTHTFKSTEDRFGMKSAALADVAYKDDTAMKSLGKFLAAEETKIMITGGLFQAEEKFQSPEQIWPKCVILVNSNDWDPHFAYDLDPGIIDRIKVISTLREYEVNNLKDSIPLNKVSHGTVDLRPKAHIPYLAEKLGVHPDAIYLWCLRLATDRFWEIISDNSDPSVNKLQNEVRYWTTRLRIRFKSDTSQSIVNALALCSALRNGGDSYQMPELTPDVLARHLKDFFFVGVDKSTKKLIDIMKQRWEKEGRPSTHYYQGFREIRWPSVQLAVETHANSLSFSKTSSEVLKDMMGKLELRDGFRISTGVSYVIGDWNNCRISVEELKKEAQELLELLSDSQKDRVLNTRTTPTSEWLLNPNYSPDCAEQFRPEME